MSYPEKLAAIEQRLREMQARCDAATPGPWFVNVSPCGWQRSDKTYIRAGSPGGVGVALAQKSGGAEWSAPFIAHARTDLPALAGWALEMAARLRNDLERPDETWRAQIRIDSLAKALGIS